MAILVFISSCLSGPSPDFRVDGGELARDFVDDRGVGRGWPGFLDAAGEEPGAVVLSGMGCLFGLRGIRLQELKRLELSTLCYCYLAPHWPFLCQPDSECA